MNQLQAFTAGVCEETLFRGFMLHYLHVFPWTLNLSLALLISSVIFGFNHCIRVLAESQGLRSSAFFLAYCFCWPEIFCFRLSSIA